jgi:hypothetical protein
MAELKLQGWPRELARRGREGKGRGRRGEEGAWGGELLSSLLPCVRERRKEKREKRKWRKRGKEKKNRKFSKPGNFRGEK